MKRFLILMLSLLLLCGCAAKGSGQKVDAKPELVTKEDSGTQGDCRYENPYLTLSGVSASTAKLFDTYYAGIHDEYARRLRADAKAGATSFTVEYAQRALTSRVLSVLRTCRVENPETVTVTPAGETFDPQTGLQLSAVSLFACPKEVADVRVLDLVRARLEAGECFGFVGEEAGAVCADGVWVSGVFPAGKAGRGRHRRLSALSGAAGHSGSAVIRSAYEEKRRADPPGGGNDLRGPWGGPA